MSDSKVQIVWRNTYRSEDGTHCGFSYHDCEKAATRAGSTFLNDRENDHEKGVVTMRPHRIGLRKIDLIMWLNVYAHHPDNG